MRFEDYSIEEHKHRVAAWAAATAAKASPKCRFTIENGKKILEEIGLDGHFVVASLPEPENFDLFHKCLREKAIESATVAGISGFTHGVAAKLINIYMKMVFICGGIHEDRKSQMIHPPIDRVLLQGLIDARVGNIQIWRNAMQTGWSAFSSSEYETVIEEVRRAMRERSSPPWKIEACWTGHQ